MTVTAPRPEDTTDGPAATPATGPTAGLGGPFPRLLAWVLTAGGALGLLASFDLLYERILLLLDPDYIPTCSINPVVDCGVVASSPEASLFWDVPNPVIGVAAFSVVVTLGVLALLGTVLRRTVVLGLTAGGLLGTVFVHHLILATVFRIGVLCPYCMVVWAVTVPIFWYAALHAAATGLLGGRVARSAAVRTLTGVHALPVVLWYVAVAALVGVGFADSWAALL